MMGEEGWEGAPDIVQSVRVGEGGGCVMVREGELVSAACSEELSYVCLFTYSGKIMVC